MEEKFCKFCAAKIPMDAVLCSHCGRQVEELKTSKSEQPSVVINNSNMNSNVNTNTNNNNRGYVRGREKNKFVALVLCACLGWAGAHKFYEGKAGMGIIYLFTCGLFFVGIVLDFIALLAKPNPYYV